MKNNMILIEDDKVHYLGETLGEHGDKLKCLFHKMGRELHDYLSYKNKFITSMKKDVDQKTMMLDEFKHFKNAHKEFFDCLKTYADSDEEKVIFDSITR